MLFSSESFVFIFLPIVFGVYLFVARYTGRTTVFGWLAVCSLFFYAYWNPPYLTLLLGSILVNYLIGRALMSRRSRPLLITGVVFNLAIIGVFKYFGFFVGSVNTVFAASLPSPEIILPLAISFFTFQQIAYLVDVHKGYVTDTSLLDYVLFVSFFPQLIAGPIVHHQEIIPQFKARDTKQFNVSEFFSGVAIFIIGLQKKVVIADGIGAHAENFFQNISGQDPTMIQAWVGTLAYTFQIYFDFSGYSDMAIGLARMFGIRLPENFNSPYKAKSIIEFWQRWHMTLSRFLKDYLYIPLGGNRNGTQRRYLNILITMLLGGLWHGAAWTFVFWGFLHGVFIVINHLWREGRKALGLELNRSSWFGRAVSRTITLLAVVVTWVFFRAESWSDAIATLRGMIGLNGLILPASWRALFDDGSTVLTSVGVQFSETLPYQYGTLGVLFCLGIFVLVLPNTREIMAACIERDAGHRLFPRSAIVPLVSVFGLIGLLVVVAKGSHSNDFIYMVF